MRACERPGVLLGPAAIARIGLALACSAPLLLYLGWSSNADLWLADRMFDRQRMLFPWRDAWLAATFNHRILKGLLATAAVLLIVAAAADAGYRFRRLDGIRMRLRVIALSALFVPLVISALKQTSNAHCPWDLARYGGSHPYLRLFEALPAGVMPGHCLPAGHASSALWLISFAVLWLPRRPGHAALAATAALAAGFAVGWLQQLRGAHFLTHTLWSVWIAAALVTVITAAVQYAHRIPVRAGRS